VLALLRSLMDGEEVEYEVDHKVGGFFLDFVIAADRNFLFNSMAMM